PAKDHVAGPGGGVIRGGAVGPDEQVGEAVAIDIARRAHAAPGDVAGRFAVDLEAVVSVECREVELRGEAARLAKDHVAGPGERAMRGGVGGSDEQVDKAVAIDIARRAHAEPGLVAGRFAAELKAGLAVEAAEIEHRHRGRRDAGFEGFYRMR